MRKIKVFFCVFTLSGIIALVCVQIFAFVFVYVSMSYMPYVIQPLKFLTFYSICRIYHVPTDSAVSHVHMYV